jgi:CRP/FNR family cyclic AMP-dependent transcriptional regulator
MRLPRRDNILPKGPGVLAAVKHDLTFDPRPFLDKGWDQRTVLQCSKDQLIFSQDDPADAVFYIESGVLKITIHSRQGKKAVVALLGSGDFLGEECLANQTRRKATAAMMTDGSIVRIEKAAMLQLLHSEPRFAELFVSYLAARKFRIEEDLADQLLSSSEKRLARRLILLADPREVGALRTTLRINQDTLAAMVGTTQPRVSFFMNKFRRMGYINYNGDLTVDRSLSAFVQE